MSSADFKGQLLDGKYLLTKKLGEGGMGSVYSGQHVTMGKMVAVKILHSELTGNEEVVHRFIREAQAAVAISHQNVIDILDLGALPTGEPFMVMEYLRGAGLDEIITLKRQLDLPTACAVLEATLHAIGAAHEKGVVHRDLKPENIFLNQPNDSNDDIQIKLIDFGISKIQDQQVTKLTQEGTTLGTPAYMSPEQVRGLDDINHLTDIYAAGIILYEMLSGDTPYEGQQYAALLANILTTNPRHPKDVYDGFPMNAWPVIKKAISKNPADRYGSAAEMLEAVLGLCTEKSRNEGIARLPALIAMAASQKSIPPHLDMGYSQRDANEILSDLAQQNSELAAKTILRSTPPELRSEKSEDTVALRFNSLFAKVTTLMNIARGQTRLVVKELPGKLKTVKDTGKYALFNSPHKKRFRIVTAILAFCIVFLVGLCAVDDGKIKVEIVGLPDSATVYYNNEPVDENPFEVERGNKWTPIRVENKSRTRMRFVVIPSENMRIKYIPGGRKAELIEEQPESEKKGREDDNDTPSVPAASREERPAPESESPEKASEETPSAAPEESSNTPSPAPPAEEVHSQPHQAGEPDATSAGKSESRPTQKKSARTTKSPQKTVTRPKQTKPKNTGGKGSTAKGTAKQKKTTKSGKATQKKSKSTGTGKKNTGSGKSKKSPFKRLRNEIKRTFKN